MSFLNTIGSKIMENAPAIAIVLVLAVFIADMVKLGYTAETEQDKAKVAQVVTKSTAVAAVAAYCMAAKEPMPIAAAIAGAIYLSMNGWKPLSA